MAPAPLGIRRNPCYGRTRTHMKTTTSSDTNEVAQLEKLRFQLSTDIEALHLQEASLKEYEQRLRLLVEQAQPAQAAAQPVPPSATQYIVQNGPSRAELDAEWEKYSRSHALLEAARRGLCDDRMAVKDREERIQLRETEVTRRESWVKVREQELNLLAASLAQAREQVVIKAKSSFNMAPFLAARNLLARHC